MLNDNTHNTEEKRIKAVELLAQTTTSDQDTIKDAIIKGDDRMQSGSKYGWIESDQKWETAINCANHFAAAQILHEDTNGGEALDRILAEGNKMLRTLNDIAKNQGRVIFQRTTSKKLGTFS